MKGHGCWAYLQEQLNIKWETLGNIKWLTIKWQLLENDRTLKWHCLRNGRTSSWLILVVAGESTWNHGVSSKFAKVPAHTQTSCHPPKFKSIHGPGFQSDHCQELSHMAPEMLEKWFLILERVASHSFVDPTGDPPYLSHRRWTEEILHQLRGGFLPQFL